MSNFINPTTNTAPIRSTGAAPLGAAPLASTPGAPLMSGATPGLSNTAAAAPMGASPLGAAAPLGGTTATTMLPATGTGLMGHNDKHLSKQERKALKHQNKALKHDHHHHGHGLTGTGLPLAGGATRGTGLGTTGLMHGATNVVQHQPIVEREVIVERPVEVRREHHIQPVIHERQHQIQPVIRTEITTERKDLVTDRNVMMPAVVEQPRVATTGLLHQTTTDQRGILPGTTGMTGAHHATMGQKIKGTVKEVQGSLTHNPMKKEEGRLLKQGIEPTTAGMMGTTGMTGTTTPGMLGTTGTGMMGTTPGAMGTTGTTTPGVMGNTTRI